VVADTESSLWFHKARENAVDLYDFMSTISLVGHNVWKLEINTMEAYFWVLKGTLTTQDDCEVLYNTNLLKEWYLWLQQCVLQSVGEI
jgi:hypothetical protein